MAKSLPCGCELAPGLRPGRLRRLFGLVRRDRRRSGFSPVCEDLGGIDLSPAAAGAETSLRSASAPADDSMWPEVRPEFNIQGGRYGRMRVNGPGLGHVSGGGDVEAR